MKIILRILFIPTIFIYITLIMIFIIPYSFIWWILTGKVPHEWADKIWNKIFKMAE